MALPLLLRAVLVLDGDRPLPGDEPEAPLAAHREVELIERMVSPFATVPLDLELLADARGQLWLHGWSTDPEWAAGPDLLVYMDPQPEARRRRQDPALGPSGEAILLGALGERRWRLPTGTTGGGALLLYSNAHRKVIDRARLPVITRIVPASFP